MATAVQPWGMGRLAPYPHTIEFPFARTEIDPDSQVTRYFDADGRRVEMGTHGTNNSTSSSTSTGADGGGAQPPAPADSDSIDDTASD
ncbi:putative ATP-grasp-modified RiPP [Streptomyces sp. SR27]|uniref:putative ATP-grasp-modified RiPP n=1 Tax=Streptomyces sp. SR27 TaxID=3076630 RepID=UPI00295B6277|nr:putative ATP-grasp-modified RiPP [Streptomyces sp. SR27]MDV9189569.1 putative ATP-grasp-modified RiPP [Streptomyces sp. SR27]